MLRFALCARPAHLGIVIRFITKFPLCALARTACSRRVEDGFSRWDVLFVIGPVPLDFPEGPPTRPARRGEHQRQIYSFGAFRNFRHKLSGILWFVSQD